MTTTASISTTADKPPVSSHDIVLAAERLERLKHERSAHLKQQIAEIRRSAAAACAPLIAELDALNGGTNHKRRKPTNRQPAGEQWKKTRAMMIANGGKASFTEIAATVPGDKLHAVGAHIGNWMRAGKIQRVERGRYILPPEQA